MPRTAFVTGANGFVGLNLVGELLAQGWRVIALQGALTGRQPTLTMETVLQATRVLSCDCAKAMRELGYRAVPLREIVAGSVAWLAAEGLLPEARSGRSATR